MVNQDIQAILQDYKSEKGTPLYSALEELNNNATKASCTSDNHYQQLFSNTPVVTMLIDPTTGNILDANDAATSYYQYNKDELLQKSFFDINTLNSNEVKKQMQLAENEEKTHFHFKHKTKNGDVKHVRAYIHPIKINNRNVLHSTIFDVEETHKIKKEADLLTRAVLQNPTSIVITDKDGKIEFVNPRFTELTGYTANEVIGKRPSILKSGDTPQKAYDNLWKTVTKGEVWRGEFINQRKNGELFIESASITPVINESGEITGYLGIKADITEQRKIEKELVSLNKQLKERYEEIHSAYEEINASNEELHKTNELLGQERKQFLSLLNSIPEPIYVAKKDEHTILFANKALLEIFGPDIVGQKCYEALRKRTTECEYCTNSIIFNQDGAYFWEDYNEALNKHYYRIDRALTWVDGNPVRFQLAIDITKQKETENALLKVQQTLINKSNELTELNATKDKFFSIIAHDLKNPFNSIMGFSSILTRKIGTLQKEQIKEHAEQIYDSSKSAYKLLENLLDWSRSQTGKINFDPENFNLFDLMDEVIVSIYSQASSKQVKIDTQIPQKFEIHGDRNMIATVLRNMLSNAIKFSHRNSKVIVSVKAGVQRLSEKQLYTLISITDYGLGIPETLQKKLFKISEKTTSPGTEKERGTGLGLLLCKDFIDKHGGFIDIESEEGKGSTFTIFLPTEHSGN